MMSKNIWLDGMLGVVVGDALGCPVEFSSREERNADPVTSMRGYGTYNLPAGSWTDDSSMALACLDSILICDRIDLADMMGGFAKWLRDGEYTPFGDVFDYGITCKDAIVWYLREQDPYTCGRSGEKDNGNGSLMRIMPACLYCYKKGMKEDRMGEAIGIIHEVSGLTHNHLRSKIACGLYYFMACEILDGTGTLRERMQRGLDKGFAYYQENPDTIKELKYYDRIRNVKAFADLSDETIRSGGYVVESMEAAVWCLANTDSYGECTLLAVNLGHDTDTTSAIAGGLAGLYYGIEGITKEWIDVIWRLDWIKGLCETANEQF